MSRDKHISVDEYIELKKRDLIDNWVSYGILKDEIVKFKIKNHNLVEPLNIPKVENLVGYYDFNLQTNTDTNRTTVPNLARNENDAVLHNFGFKETDYSVDNTRVNVSKVGEIGGKNYYKKVIKPHGTQSVGGAFVSFGASPLDKGSYSAVVKFKYSGNADYAQPTLGLYNWTTQAFITSVNFDPSAQVPNEDGFYQLKISHNQTVDSTDSVAVLFYGARTKTDWLETGARIDTYFYIKHLKIGNIALRSGFFE